MLEIVKNELGRFKHSVDFLANSSHIIESAAISASLVSINHLALRNYYIKKNQTASHSKLLNLLKYRPNSSD